ncbi:response regulator transcription factor [Spirillospora sp. NPDC052269]
MIRLMIVDDQHLVRSGLRMLCDSAPDLEVVGEAADGHEAVRMAARLAPDLILMDLRMPLLNGTAATERILRDRPGTVVVVLTTFDDDDHLYPALSAGARGFLAKDVEPAQLLDAVRRAAAGDTPFSPRALRRLVEQAVAARDARAAEPGSAAPDLTDREREVLTLVAEGLANAEIAARLHLGVTTVKTHLASLLAKTGCQNRVQLAVHAARNDLVDGSPVDMR